MLAPRPPNACGQSGLLRSLLGKSAKYGSGAFRPEWQPTEKMILLRKSVLRWVTSSAYTLVGSFGKNRLCAKCELSEFKPRATDGPKKLARNCLAVQLSLISVSGAAMPKLCNFALMSLACWVRNE